MKTRRLKLGVRLYIRRWIKHSHDWLIVGKDASSLCTVPWWFTNGASVSASQKVPGDFKAGVFEPLGDFCYGAVVADVELFA